MLIKCTKEKHLKYMKDDPVRPNLFGDDATRFTPPYTVYATVEHPDQEKPDAIVCVREASFPPTDESMLKVCSVPEPLMRVWMQGILDINAPFIEAAGRSQVEVNAVYTAAKALTEELVGGFLCAYSLWSYNRGAGRRLIQELLEAVSVENPEVCGVVTMSPKTAMAKNFHLSNGAIMFSCNDTTVNYLYGITDVPGSIH